VIAGIIAKGSYDAPRIGMVEIRAGTALGTEVCRNQPLAVPTSRNQILKAGLGSKK